MSQHNELTSLSEMEDAEYPEHWPDIPDGFELDEKTNFVGGGKEFIYVSEKFDFRISTHTDIYSGTVRVASDYRDYRIDSEEKAIEWLSDLFKLYRETLFIQIPDSDEIESIRGVKRDYTVLSYEPEERLVEWEDNLDSLNPYNSWDIHDPKSIGEHKATVEFTNGPENYMYIFENHILDVFKASSERALNSYVIPDHHLVFEELSKYDSDELEFKYISDSVGQENILKEFI